MNGSSSELFYIVSIRTVNYSIEIRTGYLPNTN